MTYLKGRRNPWRVQYTDIDGKRKSRVFREKKDAQEFEVFLDKRRTRFQAGLAVPSENILFIDLSKKFLRHRNALVAQQLLARGTFVLDESRLIKPWIPALGAYPVSMIRKSQIQEVLDQLIRDGNAPSTRNRHRSLIHSFFEFALDLELVEFNPVARIKILSEKVQVRPNGHLGVAETEKYVAKFYELTLNAPTDFKRNAEGEWQKTEGIIKYGGRLWGTLAELLAFAGPRIGEALALQWEDIRWDEDHIIVRKIVDRPVASVEERTKGQKAGGSYLLALLPRVREALIRWRQETPFYQPTDFVFADENGEPIRYERFLKIHRRVVRQAKLRHVTPHGIRATCGTNAEKAGIGKSGVQRMLGHESIATTEKYTKRDVEQVREIVRRAGELGFGGFTGKSAAHTVHANQPGTRGDFESLH